MNRMLTDALRVLGVARCPEDVFGVDPARVEAGYSMLLRLYHPDKHGDAREATEATALLNGWAAQARAKIKEGRYGQRDSGVVVQLGPDRFEDVTPLEGAAGDLANVYRARGPGGEVVLKVARVVQDSDLLAAERQALKELRGRSPNFNRYLPKLLRAGRVPGPGGTQVPVHAFERLGSHFTLGQVRERHREIDGRHVAWIWRRALEALAYTHAAGRVHGAVLPGHVLVRPEDHGATLVDWCYSVPAGRSLKAVVAAYKDFYPPEVLRKGATSPATDLYMLANTIRDLAAGRLTPLPHLLTGPLLACLLADPRKRVQDAWELHETLAKNLRKLYGEPKFVTFEM